MNKKQYEKDEKITTKNEDEYATYEEYNFIVKIGHNLSDENERLQSQLDIANKKLNKIKELVNKYGYYTLSEIPELLLIIDGE